MSHHRAAQTLHVSSAIVLLVLLSYGVIGACGRGHVEFGYNGRLGPNYWGQTFGSCVGKLQSPINIEEHIVREITLPLLNFSGFDESLTRTLYLKNNGHTAMLYSTDHNHKAYLSGGPLLGFYVFEQLHFHWGKHDREGSEDLLNNHAFSMELHAVFYKEKYGSMSKAINYFDGLTVLAFFFEASDEHQSVPAFDFIVQALPAIEKPGSEIHIDNGFRLNQLLDPVTPPNDRMQNYFTYKGSLTTPPCSEVVTWVDFKYPLYLSSSQVAAFRNIRSSEGQKLTHNFRPIQPLSNRLLLHNVPKHANITDKKQMSSYIILEECIKSNSCISSASRCNLTLLSFYLTALTYFLFISTS